LRVLHVQGALIDLPREMAFDNLTNGIAIQVVEAGAVSVDGAV